MPEKVGKTKSTGSSKSDKKGGGKKDAPTTTAEEPAIVKACKEIEDKILAKQLEHEKEVHRLVLEYTSKQKQILDARKKILLEGIEEMKPEESAKNKGTPGLDGFWLHAMSKHSAFDELIQEHDEDVLQYVKDIEVQLTDSPNSGFGVTFIFAENPYFTNTELKKMYKTKCANHFNGQLDVEEVTATEIQWKEGKDVTVEMRAKKAKGPLAKKKLAKPIKTLQARRSFFRDFFRNLKPGMELDEDDLEWAMSVKMSQEDPDDVDDDDSDEKMCGYLIDHDFEVGSVIKDALVPRAVRYYTGEMADDDDSSMDEEGESESDDDDNEESSSPPKAKKKGGNAGGQQKKQEECKQQ